jgi:chitinase
MKKQEAPPLTCPSEFATPITVEITPDTITQDGASQSRVTVTARGPNGQPAPPLTVRLDTLVDGALVDFGTLSARTVVTGTDGKATATYTAPPATIGGTEQFVTIRVTPLGSDAAAATPRTASLRLVPQGVINPPAGLVPAFTVSPASPAENQPVLFDASTSTANTTITSYSWNFGNGRSASGVTASTTFDEARGYFVTLTIQDEFGRSASTTQVVTVSSVGTLPRAIFVFSPPSPVSVGTNVTFDASDSRPNLNATIISYDWTFGDTTKVATSSQPTILKSYSAVGNYTVTLTIRDSIGGTATTTRTITVQ